MYSFRILMVSLIWVASVYGDISQYFKKAEGKSDSHRMKNIDFIYVINLDPRPEKFASCTAQLHPYGIYPYRFSAVNGWELSLEAINNLGVKLSPEMQKNHWGTRYPLNGDGTPYHEIVQQVGEAYFCHCMSRGAIGIVLSHLSILQDAYDSGYETIWVMEDDIQLIQDPHLISGVIDTLDKVLGKDRWDILFTDQDTKNQKGEYVPCLGYAWRPNFEPSNPQVFATRSVVPQTNVTRVGARYGAYSMILRRSGMKKILDFIKTYHIFLPYDMDFYLPPGIRMFAVTRDIVSTQIQAFSDNGSPNYLKTP